MKIKDKIFLLSLENDIKILSNLKYSNLQIAKYITDATNLYLKNRV